MTTKRLLIAVHAVVGLALLAGPAAAQSMPADYQAVLTTLGKSGDFRDGVLKVNIPRNDIAVTIAGRPAPTPFGFGGWVAFTKGDHGMDVVATWPCSNMKSRPCWLPCVHAASTSPPSTTT